MKSVIPQVSQLTQLLQEHWHQISRQSSRSLHGVAMYVTGTKMRCCLSFLQVSWLCSDQSFGEIIVDHFLIQRL